MDYWNFDFESLFPTGLNYNDYSAFLWYLYFAFVVVCCYCIFHSPQSCITTPNLTMPCPIVFLSPQSTVLDFGKIIIYTSNLRIIRAPQRKSEASLRHHTAPPVGPEDYHQPQARERGSRRKAKALCGKEGEGVKPMAKTEDKVMGSDQSTSATLVSQSCCLAFIPLLFVLNVLLVSLTKPHLFFF